MSKKSTLKPVAAALGTTFAVSLAVSPMANAAENPFSMSELSSGYMVADAHSAEGKCGEGKCGEGKKKEGKRYYGEWVFSVYNVYNRRNPFSIFFRQDTDRPFVGQPINTEAVRLSVIGNFIPSVSYNFKF